MPLTRLLPERPNPPRSFPAFAAAGRASGGESTLAKPARPGAGELLAEVLAVSEIALWEACEGTLELVSFAPGRAENWPPSLAPGSPWDEHVYPGDREQLRAYLSQDPPRGRCVDYRLVGVRGDLEWVRHWQLGRPIGDGARRLLRGALMPIPEQKHLEWECLRMSERECNRIGRELHDDLGQVLAGVAFTMQLAAVRARRFDDGLAGEISELCGHLSAAQERVRSLARGLCPVGQRFRSLPEALEGLAAEARRHPGVDLLLDIHGEARGNNPEEIVHVYRIVQEAVANAARHGAATQVRVRLRVMPAGTRVEVTDNGAGLDPSVEAPEGLGLPVMQYRARALGGSLGFAAAVPRGLVVTLNYPAAPGASPS